MGDCDDLDCLGRCRLRAVIAIAEQIIMRLKGHRDSGALKDFKLDMKVNQGKSKNSGEELDPSNENWC